MGQFIARHNIKVYKKHEPRVTPACNWRGGSTKCPVDDACQTEVVVYQTTVTRDDNSLQDRLEDRLYVQCTDMNNENREGTSLSNYVWKLKSDNIQYKITCKILTRRQSFNPSTKHYNLCYKGKYYIMFRPFFI